jgi:hypothetical protein
MSGVILRAFIGGGLVAAFLALGCVPLPVQPTPAVAGRVVDRESGKPVADAIVVVRFDVRRGELLPERDLIGHREAVTDATGRFRVVRSAVPGLGSWPRYGMEARVVGVMTPAHRCTRPHRVPDSGNLVLRLDVATDAADRRASCRPVAARPDETPRYLAAWRELYPRRLTSHERASERQIDQLLLARAVFGPGENCSGPAVDLSLSPSGTHVAVALEVSHGRSIEVISLAPQPRRLARVRGEEPNPSPALRLAWSSDRDLVLWDPARPSADSMGSTRRLWSDPSAARAANQAADEGARLRPLDLSDLNDEGDARWQGRSFHVERRLDPASGLAAEALRITHPDGRTKTLALPGEACGPRGQYGRPHFRISADGGRGLDLRWIEGGCRAVSIDLESGRWQALSSNRAGGTCREGRRVPLPQLRRAVRGYLGEIEDALVAAKADPSQAYRLEVAPERATRVLARDYLGAPIALVLPAFPIDTPLRRIDVTSASGAGAASPAAPVPSDPTPELQPL